MRELIPSIQVAPLPGRAFGGTRVSALPPMEADRKTH